VICFQISTLFLLVLLALVSLLFFLLLRNFYELFLIYLWLLLVF
jgi:hypothetical protein